MLQLNNLTVAVDEKNIINNLSLSVFPGALHVIMGPNGSGKSSLAATIMGLSLYKIISGTMHSYGQNLQAMSLSDRSRFGIFLAFQQPVTIPGVTVFQFLKEIAIQAKKIVSPDAFQDLLNKLLSEVGLDLSFLYRGLHENFSGGEKKRLEIVQMLLLEPRLIILDEIDSGLDVDALRSIGQAIEGYLRNNSTASCIIITHYRRILDYVRPNFVHVMVQGNIVASGDIQLSYAIEKEGYDSYVQ